MTQSQGYGPNLGRMMPERMAFSGRGTQSSPYRISTAEDLARIATMVRIGTDFAGRYFVLENDIDLTEFLSEGSPGYNGGA